MTDRPILFSTSMVRAILTGRKTQTRRVIRLPGWATGMECDGNLVDYEPGVFHGLEFVDARHGKWHASTNPKGRSPCYVKIPYRVGDRLWVRETFCWGSEGEPGAKDFPIYRANYNAEEARLFKPWIPSIHMPRRASRITLEVTGVRVERLQDISEFDARMEGADPDRGNGGYAGMYSKAGMDPFAYRRGFRLLWNSINAKRGFGWDANPWVVVCSFRVDGAS